MPFRFPAILTLFVSLNWAEPAAADGHGDRLAAALSAQPEEVQARYRYRHPQETLMFFDIKPGMTVVEALPGGGWYSKVLINYLGGEGHLIGADYAQDMWPLFGFFPEEMIEGKKTWVQDWTSDAQEWRTVDSARISAFQLGTLPDELKGTADAVLLIRALHNLARFESQGGYLSAALRNVHDVLKPGGIVGVVQHQAPDHMPDAWASGQRGYLKQDYVVQRMTEIGFEFMGEIDVNQNPKDQPGEDDIVWRLPPTLATSRDDAEARARYQDIGESNRMTLKFRKPE